jgi:hypothetical protein
MPRPQTLESNFGYDDDFVIETALRQNLQELRSSRLHTAGKSGEHVTVGKNWILKFVIRIPGSRSVPKCHESGTLSTTFTATYTIPYILLQA